MCSSEPRVRRQQRRPERFSESDVGGVVGSEHGPEPPDPVEEGRHWISGEIEVHEVTERVLRLSKTHLRPRDKLPKRRNDLQVDDMRRNEIGFPYDTLSDPLPSLTAAD